MYPSTNDVQSYIENGYWIAPIIFNTEQVSRLRHAFERIYTHDLDHAPWPYVEPVIGDSEAGIRTALFSAFVNEDIYSAVTHPVLAKIVARLLGVQLVRYWQDQSIWKPGSICETQVGNIGFHQDYAYWQDSSSVNMVSANIALQDSTINNGCLRVFPGSHMYGLLTAENGNFFDTDLESLRTRFRDRTGVEDTPLELKAGQVSFHHSLLVHGSGPNVTDEPRLVLAPAYMPDGTYYREEGQEPCPHSDFLGHERTHGKLYAEPHFPLLQ